MDKTTVIDLKPWIKQTINQDNILFIRDTNVLLLLLNLYICIIFKI